MPLNANTGLEKVKSCDGVELASSPYTDVFSMSWGSYRSVTIESFTVV